MSITKEIGSNIREQRRRRGLTQKQLAEQLFVSSSAVSKWEMNEAIPDIHMVMQLADIFQISVAELLGKEEKAELHVEDTIAEQKVFETEPDESNESDKQPITPKKRPCKYLKILIPIVIIAILGCIAFCFVKSNTFSCRIVDEFYDDTSNHWGYNPIYHIVVEYNAEFDLEDATAYSMEIRADYEHWFEKAEVILITYFEEYTDRRAVFETEFQSFLLPLPDSE